METHSSVLAWRILWIPMDSSYGGAWWVVVHGGHTESNRTERTHMRARVHTHTHTQET